METTVLNKARALEHLQLNNPDPPLKRAMEDRGPKYSALLVLVHSSGSGTNAPPACQMNIPPGMVARASRMPLGTREDRFNALAIHVDWWIFKTRRLSHSFARSKSETISVSEGHVEWKTYCDKPQCSHRTGITHDSSGIGNEILRRERRAPERISLLQGCMSLSGEAVGGDA